MEEEIEIQTPDGTPRGFLFRLDEQPRPGILHLTDIGGTRDVNRELSRRLAAEGYTVLMPNIFYRTGSPPFFASHPNMADEAAKKRIAELSGPLTPEAMERDGSAYIDFLAGQKSVNSGRMGVVGYCFSGGMALRIAAFRADKIMAAACFHGGRLFIDEPASPHLLLPRIKARLYFGHAVQDRSMPAEAIQKLGQALQAWGGQYESEVYDGAFHSWTMPDSPVYNCAQAERAFDKLTQLFNATLK